MWSRTRSRLSPKPSKAAVGQSFRRHHRHRDGLKPQMLGGMVAVGGKPVNFGERMNFKGVMFSDVPNLASVSAMPRGRSSDLIWAYTAA